MNEGPYLAPLSLPTGDLVTLTKAQWDAFTVVCTAGQFNNGVGVYRPGVRVVATESSMPNPWSMEANAVACRELIRLGLIEVRGGRTKRVKMTNEGWSALNRSKDFLGYVQQLAKALRTIMDTSTHSMNIHLKERTDRYIKASRLTAESSGLVE